MSTTQPEEQIPSMGERMKEALAPKGIPADDRGRMRMVMDSLILHIHPSKVEVRSLRFTYTWGLGGLSALLVMILGFTGILLQMNYTPSPMQAYQDILNLQSTVWFGALIRNLHHWSANLMIVVAVLHLLRVFFTGGHRRPRELNWILGVIMLLLVLASNFTGYLLPWDQLAYWAITVGTSILSYVPLIGTWLTGLLLGGPEVGAATLLNFYSLHISIIPLSIFGLMSFHFWRVRKDGGLTVPKSPGQTEKPKPEKVTTIPNLVRREAAWALLWIAILLIIGMLTPAPLEGIANPQVSPNPAKAPWYFLGIQELLLHFHPTIAAVVIPGIALTALMLLPFFDVDTESVGVYFRSWRGRYLSLIAVGLGLIVTPIWVVADEFLIDWVGWLPSWPSLISNGLVPLSLVLLGLFILDEGLHKLARTTREERMLILFIFLFTALIVLTIIGIYFRGPGMELFWPWEMPVVTH